MKAKFNRIRDWLIKLLGGHTETEYRKLLNTPLPVEVHAINTCNAERLCVQIRIPRSRLISPAYPPFEFLRHDLTRKLIPLVEERMKILQLSDYPDFHDNLVFEASIYVVKEA